MGRLPEKLDDIEFDLLTRGIKLRYGYDFSQYSTASFRRRVTAFMISNTIDTVSDLTSQLLHDPDLFESFVYRISVTVTEMFRDPEVFSFFRENIVPELSTFPRINIWVAGCATGEEAYSVAIVLDEAGLMDRTEIFATDINKPSIAKAYEGAFTSEQIQVATRNYISSGGSNSFNSYYSADTAGVRLNRSLRSKITFSDHNLTVDQSFKTFQLILCRNVLIYFNKKLQNKVLKLFDQSLAYNGILWLGTKETLEFSDIREKYTPLSEPCRIYRKTKRSES